MVDVERRVPPPALHQPVDEPLEGRALLPLVVGPPVVEHGGDAVPTVTAPEQVLQPALGVGKAFHVEEHVAVGGRRQQGEAAARLAPDPGAGARQSGCGCPRDSSWSRGLDASRSKTGSDTLRHAAAGLAARASAVSVAIPASSSRRTWPRVMLATRLRWSDCSSSFSAAFSQRPQLRSSPGSGRTAPGPRPPGTRRTSGGAGGSSGRSAGSGYGRSSPWPRTNTISVGPEAADRLQHVGVGAELDQEAGLGRAGELGVPGRVVPAARSRSRRRGSGRGSRGSRPSRRTTRWAW